jgi:hypothetical protein
VQAATPKTPDIDVPEAKLLEGKETYGRRVAQSVLDQIGPEVKSLQAKAAHADLAKQQAAAAEAGRRDAELRFAQREKLLQVERDKVKDQQTKLDQIRLLVVNGGERLALFQAELRKKLDQVRDRGRSR